jgi:hypothetical protein
VAEVAGNTSRRGRRDLEGAWRRPEQPRVRRRRENRQGMEPSVAKQGSVRRVQAAISLVVDKVT